MSIVESRKQWNSEGLPETLMSVEALATWLTDLNITRAYFVRDEAGELVPSHPELGPVARALKGSPGFADHEAVFVGRSPVSPILYFAFVHSTVRGLAQGGLRLSHYTTLADVCIDGLRLAQGMTRKNATAGLFWGGGKGIIATPAEFRNPEALSGALRERVLDGYAEFVASLGGVYYTAEDVGTKTPDMDRILQGCRFVTCISVERGGSGNPSSHTADGVLSAMRAGWQWCTGKATLKDVRVAVQGVGNVGGELVARLADAGAQLVVTDVSEVALASIGARYSHVEVVEPDAIFDVDADVFAPCARGAQVNATTIPRLRARLIVGAANNILGDEQADAQRLLERGIVYVPDFFANRMGIVHCCNEMYGSDPAFVADSLARVFPDTLSLLDEARSRSVDSVRVAHERADRAALEAHPLYPGIGQRLIRRIVEGDWKVGKLG